jgi:hypothetical protein
VKGDNEQTVSRLANSDIVRIRAARQTDVGERGRERGGERERESATQIRREGEGRGARCYHSHMLGWLVPPVQVWQSLSFGGNPA